jgi:hypothetical protein
MAFQVCIWYVCNFDRFLINFLANVTTDYTLRSDNSFYFGLRVGATVWTQVKFVSIVFKCSYFW